MNADTPSAAQCLATGIPFRKIPASSRRRQKGWFVLEMMDIPLAVRLMVSNLEGQKLARQNLAKLTESKLVDPESKAVVDALAQSLLKRWRENIRAGRAVMHLFCAETHNLAHQLPHIGVLFKMLASHMVEMDETGALIRKIAPELWWEKKTVQGPVDVVAEVAANGASASETQSKLGELSELAVRAPTTTKPP